MIIAASFNTQDTDMWENRGLMYGDGVFETMRAVNQQLPLWYWHQRRLLTALQYLQIKPPDLTAIEQIIKVKVSEPDAVLRMTVFRRQTERGYQPKSSDCDWLISQHPYSQQDQPQTLALAEHRLSPQPLLKGIKHLNRLPQVLIAAELNEKKADDLMVLSQQGQVIETSCQNLLMIKDNQIYTPEIQNCGVEGVALSWLQAHFELICQPLLLDDFSRADVIMTANAVHGFRLVKRIKSLGDYQINHPIYDRISNLWQQQLLSINSA